MRGDLFAGEIGLLDKFRIILEVLHKNSIFRTCAPRQRPLECTAQPSSNHVLFSRCMLNPKLDSHAQGGFSRTLLPRFTLTLRCHSLHDSHLSQRQTFHLMRVLCNQHKTLTLVFRWRIQIP